MSALYFPLSLMGLDYASTNFNYHYWLNRNCLNICLINVAQSCVIPHYIDNESSGRL